ncbi:hypothetical protein H257_13980 [Aphanomyces astaci]|uniref:Rab11 family GTPase n=1 Tax=Aphanomyces astaci TaxID=112090 RepID=W4FSX7_APHAT|nr:hypothetical protein H257_13980 [Aphanomyces astaci]ETV70605.1 hypothetical protein H257_13980 [Aphanomyces astaci]|eukprot:XP_009839988.1 hypothetical protein H257_13980 [Aphanomyces astaci]
MASSTTSAITPTGISTTTTPKATSFAATGASSPVVKRVSPSFLKLVQNISLFEPEPLTPREFLTKFYTERNLPEKLTDVDALVAYYGTNAAKMLVLYTELDKRYGTTFAANPPCKFKDEWVRRPDVVQAATTATATSSTAKPPVNKVILLGNSGVGKTNLLSRLAKGEFSTDFASTIGVEFLTHVMEVDGVPVKAQIWDTAGQERFHAMMSTYYRKAVGALLVFDVTDKTTFDGIQKWLDQLLQVAEPGLTTVLVGNKADVDLNKRAVTTAEAQAYAASHHMMYLETSAKTGSNVDKAFRDLLTTVHRLQSYTSTDHDTHSTLDLHAKFAPAAPDSFCG